MVAGPVWPAVAPVAYVDGGPVPGAGQGLPGALGDGRVKLDRGYLVVAEALREDGGVVAGARSDLEHPFGTGHVEGVEHHGHEAGLG